MKQYIKDNKIYNTPIVIEQNSMKIYTNDEQKILANGYSVYVPSQVPQYKPTYTLDELIQRSNQKINKQTDNKILSGFVWHDMRFWLSLENQINFLGLYNSRFSFPCQVKHNDGLYSFESYSQYQDFYRSAVSYITDCIHQGWDLKANAQKEIRKEYQENQDEYRINYQVQLNNQDI